MGRGRDLVKMFFELGDLRNKLLAGATSSISSDCSLYFEGTDEEMRNACIS
jgi:hypothetical protein